MNSVLAVLLFLVPQQDRKKYPLDYPPALPGGRGLVTDESPDFLRRPAGLREGVGVASTPPRIDFLYYPGQDHAGNPWSVWGDGCASGEKYYSAIGDHHHPKGTARVYEYDAATKTLRMLADVRATLEADGRIPAGMNYVPSKVHSRIDLGSDGWLYYATHRGSPGSTTDANGYQGDWILRTHPESGKTEVVAAFPVEKHAIPMSVLDPERLIFYGGTAPGKNAPLQDIVFFAFDLKSRRRVFSAGGGPERCAILSSSTGRLYWDRKRFDPAKDHLLEDSVAPAVRSATRETPQGLVYGTSGNKADLWAFDVRTETLVPLGTAAVGKQEYITSIDADPSGRFLYYVPGAHGGAAGDGTPIVQFDVRTKTRKVLAFLHPYYVEKYGYTPDGTFSTAVDPKGERLYITWNGMRKGQPRFWESCALMVVHIPDSERRP